MKVNNRVVEEIMGIMPKIVRLSISCDPHTDEQNMPGTH